MTLKVLCLHGYRQTKDTFREKTGAFRKHLKKNVEFHFMDAPHAVTQGLEEGDSTEQRGWYFNKPGWFKSSEPSDECIGFEESLAAVRESFAAESGPFDGVVAFSQGAAFLGILCRLQEWGELGFSFKFAVFFSGFKSLCKPHQVYYGDPINLPSLHCFGSEDEIVKAERSKELAEQFVNPVIVTFPGGHYVPGTSALKSQFLDFFAKFL